MKNNNVIVRKKGKINSRPAISRNWNGYELTDEQLEAINICLEGKDTKIEAYAGTGKTFTLLAIADHLKQKKGLYVAFNRNIAHEAKAKFPNNVDCRTAHSLAYQEVGYKYKDRLLRVPASKLCDFVNFKNNHKVEREDAGYIFLDTIKTFCHSDADKPNNQHMEEILKHKSAESERKKIVKQLMPYVYKLWDYMSDPQYNIPITHDVYLKLWQLKKPKLPANYILFDEAHDANPVILDVIKNQNDSQKIYVGDRYQQIYKWRGAINAMDKLYTERHCFLTKSFRFGDKIANVASDIINYYYKVQVSIQGNNSGSTSKIQNSDTKVHIFRTNFRLISFCVPCVENSYNVAIVGGVEQTLKILNDIKKLKAGKKILQGELALFNSWRELVKFANTEAGAEYKPLVNLVFAYGINYLIDLFESIGDFPESKSDYILTTAHKAKGREWSSVKVHDDFSFATSPVNGIDDEINLLYVSATRAKNILNISECNSILQIYNEDKQKELREAVRSNSYENIHNYNKNNNYNDNQEFNASTENYFNDVNDLDFEACLKLLNLDKNFSENELIVSYREKMKKCHPDYVQQLDEEIKNLAENKAKFLNTAYTKLLAYLDNN